MSVAAGMAFLEKIVFTVKMVSVLILLIGLILCIKNLLAAAFGKKNKGNSHTQIQKIKNDLGWFVLLGLEILIIADIIESIINPSLTDLARLGAMVAIRTVISYFLNKEIRETNAEIEKMNAGPKE